ncbi:MAG TPA: hypothetical protein VMZ90_03190 [Vicinamibacterales bacterium]|nr:hypothetical protein [Vicinamibacterales bacterium]
MSNADVILIVMLMVLVAGFCVIADRLKELTRVVGRNQADDQEKAVEQRR